MKSTAATAENRRWLVRCPHWSYCLLVGIIVSISLAVPLVLIPYFLRDDYATGSDLLSCSPVLYTGSVCLQELSDWQSCLPEEQNTSINSTDVFISSSINQELVESQAASLFDGLQQVWPSHKCEMEFREFWCLLFFGVCDGQNRLPSFDLCSSLQTGACYDLIQFATSVPDFSTIILNCNNFRLGQPPPCRNETERIDVFNVSCSDGFFYDENSLLCKPKCGEWSPLSPSVYTANFVLLILGSVSSFIVCTVILVLSFIQYKKIFTFPSVLIIYSSATVLVISLLDFVSFLPFNSLFCKSQDLIENLNGGEFSSTFCKFQGGFFLYTSLVVTFFWLFQTAVYFWVVIYPVHFRTFNASGKLKIFHLASVIISLTLPVIPIVGMSLSRGFAPSIFVPRKCLPLDLEVFFYIFSVPFVLIAICAISFLVITLWHVGNMRFRLQRKPFPKDSKFRATEVKLIILLVAYMCVAFQSTLSANITLSHTGQHSRVLGDNLLCESLGDPEVECSREGFRELEQDSIVETFVYIAFALYPSVFFVFLLPPRLCSCVCNKKEVSVPALTSPTASTQA